MNIMTLKKIPNSSEKRRLLYVALFIFILFSFLIIQFYHIQILEGKKWAIQAQKQHFFIVKEPFIRGSFYSNPFIKKNHPAIPQPFVIDVPKFHLYADPESIPIPLKEEIVDHLMAFLDISISEKLHLQEQLDKSSRSRKLAMWLDKETHQNLLKWWQGYAKIHKIPRNALFFIKDYQRSYPYGKVLGNVLHTIQNQKDEKTRQALPTGGLELFFNSYLQGKQGKRRLMRSPRNSLETGEVIDYPEHGADIYLTINSCLQAIAEEEVEKGVKRCKAKGGWAAMMDPRTGEILALAQYPFFNPPDYQQFFNDPQLIEHTKVKAVTDANEPGSIFKPFTIALALKANQVLRQKGEKELFFPEEKIATSNGRFPGRSKPISDTRVHYFLNMDMGMQKSSNIYMGRLAEKIVGRLGNEWYRRQLQQLFGFGQKTFIELPAESPGILPTPGKYHPSGALEWSLPTPFSLAIGHNIQVNSIQILRAYSVLANGGFLVKPTIIRQIVKKDRNAQTQILVDHTTKERIAQFPRVLEEDIVKRVVQSMRYVTKPGGTAIKADVPGYTEVCKTSTAKKIIDGVYSERLYCPTLAGFTPAVHPAFVLVVTMDEPEYGYIPGVGKNHNGGNCTANVFREIATRSLAYLGIPPDDPYGYPYGDPRSNPEKASWMNETRRLQEIYKKWNNISEN
ncbi:putative penicillin-binding protein 2 (transglycosylase/transpeptidase) [Candidatus Protochlamydia amoebophila]|uniref:Putative penicillin-binding protein 2 (Transglycosylase/transpeptidase) n=2 Tax=Candidatus Protochlamydia amoebophila TaxID=362787 RepID=A0A0C1JQW7_9BACT|nr:putative penicillin-binding protein 2 (transglycosylase/transpeptidase) [Candidatus Protochlamydia amoebophila]